VGITSISNNNNWGSKGSSAQLDKLSFDTLPSGNGLEQGEVLTPLLFNFALHYVITRIQINKGGLILSDTYNFSVIVMVSI